MNALLVAGVVVDCYGNFLCGSGSLWVVVGFFWVVVGLCGL